jgi:transcriptional regulator with XRE-family HTH domain
MSRTLDDPRYIDLIDALKQHRKDNGLTQEDVAAALGKPQSYVAKIERRERRLDILEFLDLCAALGIESGIILKKFE